VKIGTITRPGLAGMAVSVALLWGCLIGEHIIMRHAYLEQARALYHLKQLRRQRQAEPVSTPIPHGAHALRPAAG
jgi:hypothetical protein